MADTQSTAAARDGAGRRRWLQDGEGRAQVRQETGSKLSALAQDREQKRSAQRQAVCGGRIAWTQRLNEQRRKRKQGGCPGFSHGPLLGSSWGEGARTGGEVLTGGAIQERALNTSLMPGFPTFTDSQGTLSTNPQN